MQRVATSRSIRACARALTTTTTTSIQQVTSMAAAAPTAARSSIFSSLRATSRSGTPFNTARYISFKSWMGNAKDEKVGAEAGKEQQAAEQGQQQQQQSQEQTEQVETDPRVTELQTALETAQNDNKELREKYLRALAEMENVRERAKHQVQDAKDFGIQKFAKDMLEIADVLQLALDNVPKVERDSPANQALHDLYDGLVTTNKLLHHIFERHHLHTINPLGEKFDPNFHDALFEVPPSPDNASGTIAVVTKIGYSLNGRTIRPACVGVVAKA